MIRFLPLARAAAAAFLVASAPAAADYWGDYGNAWLREQLRRDNADRFWTDLVARPQRPAEYPSTGPRTWVARDENPWANTYGTPMSSAWRVTTTVPRWTGIVRLCSCYLPADARSWDGGPLTQADVVRLCNAQCN
ncbi:MAG: hypothetical protein IPP91_02730 [Betaproteobacteria bacterium]|nr:hypothetical protein [Betaproteobacteria bacterium]